MDIIDIFNFIQKESNGSNHNQIQEEEFIAKVREIAPNIIAICICYSHLSHVHLILEKAGILAQARLERDFQMVTKGRCISLDETQKHLLYEMASPETITKTVLIQGPEGSGKSILGLEVMKMKLGHYLMEHNLTGKKIQRQNKIRIFLCGTYQGKYRVPLLLQQLRADSQDIMDRCVLKLKPIKNLKMSNPEEFLNSMKTMLNEEDGESYPRTIVMLDELIPGFITHKWQDFKGIAGTDFVISFRHTFTDGLFYKDPIYRFSQRQREIFQDWGIFVSPNTVLCNLRQSFRSSQEVLELVYYMLKHSPLGDQLYKEKSFIHQPYSNPGKKPLWLQVPSLEAFIDYTNANQDLKDVNDVMVIYEPDNIKDVIETLREHCLENNWKICPSNAVMGSEAQIIIIYDMKSIHFEALSRAVIQLIFVTTQDSK